MAGVSTYHNANYFGFSLLELMLAMVILGIMLGISYPIYTQHLVTTRRTEAKTALYELAMRLERFYNEHNSYAGAEQLLNAMPIPKFYQLTISSNDTNYLLTAIPKGTQAKYDQRCGTLSLDQLGVKHITGSEPLDHCW